VTVVRVALVALYVIVVTGALVRLTGSGLGCSDWPRCSESRFIDVSTGHGAIEQINRLFTGLVAAAVAFAVLGSLLLTVRRRVLTFLSLGLVVGVVAQIVIGAIVVLTGLNPWANMAHFLVSMALLANALVLLRIAEQPTFERSRSDRDDHARLTFPWVIGLAGLCAVVTGTVVTATGPHAGDEDAVRFDFAISSVARVHSISVILTLGTIALFLYRERRSASRSTLSTKASTLIGVALLQAFIGYLQYFSGVPAFLVAFHVGFAAAVWLALVDFVYAATRAHSRVG
jgi:cytochrome c oxidase assembly protein subunit 15